MAEERINELEGQDRATEIIWSEKKKDKRIEKKMNRVAEIYGTPSRIPTCPQ